MFQRKRSATGAPSGKEEEPNKEVAWLAGSRLGGLQGLGFRVFESLA